MTTGIEPGVTVVASIPHYQYAALAAQDRDLLVQYLGPIFAPDFPMAKWVPGGLAQRLSMRNVHDFGDKRETLWIASLVSRLAPKVGVSVRRTHIIQNRLFDYAASRRVRGASVFHYVNGEASRSIRSLANRGVLFVNDERTAHPEYERAVYLDECRRLNVVPVAMPHLLDPRLSWERQAADVLIAPSSFAARTFVDRGFPEERVRIVPYGGPMVHPRADDHARVPTDLLYVGRVSPSKGLHYAIEALKELPSEYRLQVAGGVDPELRDSVSRWGVDRRIEFLGVCDKNRLESLYLRSGCLVMPSLSEGFGLVLLESIAHGTPFVATTCTGAPELLARARCGEVVDERSSSAIAAAILNVTGKGWRGYRRASIQAASESTWNRYCDDVAAVYEELV